LASRDRVALDNTTAGAGIAEDGDAVGENAFPRGSECASVADAAGKAANVGGNLDCGVAGRNGAGVANATPRPPEPKTATLLTKIPCDFAVILPLSVMPPANVAVFSTTMPLFPAEIVPLLETWMPPETTPSLLTRMPSLPAKTVPLS
jgi:hypothetical protein